MEEVERLRIEVEATHGYLRDALELLTRTARLPTHDDDAPLRNFQLLDQLEEWILVTRDATAYNSTMTTYPGRGAWTSVGKDNGSPDYVYVKGKPDDGSTPAKGLNYQAVNLGVLAIQHRLNALGYRPALVPDGDLGPATGAAIHWFQTKSNLTADSDCGPLTSAALWRPLVAKAEAQYGVLGHHLWGVAAHESLLDPGAVGASTPADRGLVQWNTSNSGLTVEQAHDPTYAIPLAAQRIAAAQTKYANKGTTLQTDCSIAQWNSPLWADQWYASRVAPNDKIAKYVNDVLAQAAT